jgi:hypothetical protein
MKYLKDLTIILLYSTSYILSDAIQFHHMSRIVMSTDKSTYRFTDETVTISLEEGMVYAISKDNKKHPFTNLYDLRIKSNGSTTKPELVLDIYSTGPYEHIQYRRKGVDSPKYTDIAVKMQRIENLFLFEEWLYLSDETTWRIFKGVRLGSVRLGHLFDDFVIFWDFEKKTFMYFNPEGKAVEMRPFELKKKGDDVLITWLNKLRRVKVMGKSDVLADVKPNGQMRYDDMKTSLVDLAILYEQYEKEIVWEPKGGPDSWLRSRRLKL